MQTGLGKETVWVYSPSLLLRSYSQIPAPGIVPSRVFIYQKLTPDADPRISPPSTPTALPFSHAKAARYPTRAQNPERERCGPCTNATSFAPAERISLPVLRFRRSQPPPCLATLRVAVRHSLTGRRPAPINLRPHRTPQVS
jgi:hypothetical protein